MPLLLGGFFEEGLALLVAETGTGAEAVGIEIPVSESGTGTDGLLTFDAEWAVADTGAGTDSQFTIKDIPVAEAGTGADTVGTPTHTFIRETWFALDPRRTFVSPARPSAVFASPSRATVQLRAYLTSEEDRVQATIISGSATIGPREVNRPFPVDLSALASIGAITAHNVTASRGGTNVTSSFIRSESLSGYNLLLILGDGASVVDTVYSVQILLTMNNSPASILELDIQIACAKVDTTIVSGNAATLAPHEANIPFDLDLTTLSAIAAITGHTVTAENGGTNVTATFVQDETLTGSTLLLILGDGTNAVNTNYEVQVLTTLATTPPSVLEQDLVVSCSIE